MTRTRISIALIAAFLAAPVFAAPTNYNLDGSGAANPNSTTGGSGTVDGVTAMAGTGWNNSNSSYYGTNGSNYGNTYTWNAAGATPSLTMSAWGSTSIGGTIAKGYIGNYGKGTGFGITSQSSGELNSSNNPDAASPYYQHAIDNVSSYESMLFSFGSSVTLNSVSVGFTGTDADATVFVWNGSGDPTSSIAGKSYAQLLTSGWVLAGNLFNMSSGSNSFTNTSAVSSSKYWMVGAFMSAAGGVNNVANDSTLDEFKITGLGVTPSLTTVPEPDSIALFGIAALGLVLAGRRKAKQA